MRHMIVSISTGRHKGLKKVKAKGIFAGGIAQMLKPTIGGMFEGQSQISDDVLKKLLKSGDEKMFFRINPGISKKAEAMDNVKESNINYLISVGEQAAKSSTFQQMIATLKTVGG